MQKSLLKQIEQTEKAIEQAQRIYKSHGTALRRSALDHRLLCMILLASCSFIAWQIDRPYLKRKLKRMAVKNLPLMAKWALIQLLHQKTASKNEI